MSPEMVGVIGIVVLLVLMFSGLWIGVSMAIVGIFGIAILKGFGHAFTVSGIMPFQQISFYPLSVLPMFVLMGVIVAETGIGSDLYNTAYKWLGQIRGGLAMATVFACAGLASVTGISAAAIVTMGKVAFPEMRRHKYDDQLATGSICCAGTLAFLIPPSLAFVLYGIFTENSVGKLYIAGILPGILLSLLFVATIMIITAFRPDAGPAGPKTSLKVKIVSLKGTWSVLTLFVVVIGSIYLGICTPTEAGAVGAFGAFIIAAVGRKLTPKVILYCFRDTALTTGMIFFIIASVWIFIHFLAISKLPFAMTNLIGGLNVPRVIIFTIIVVVYIILGTALDIMSCILLTIPIVYPVILHLGYDPIWFGVIVVVLIEMGLVSPPEGMDMYILSGITRVPLSTIFRGVWPFCVAMIVCIIILAAFPQIALVLPNMMAK